MTTIFTVHLPPGGAPRTVAGADSLVLVKDGIVWPVLVAPALWMLYKRMWLPLLGYLAIVLALTTASAITEIEPLALLMAGSTFSLLLVLEAGTLLRWSLSRKGWQTVGVVTGHDRLECERKAMDIWLSGELGGRVAGSFPSRQPQVADGAVIGLFPEPEHRT